MKISKICLSRIPKPWTACQFGAVENHWILQPCSHTIVLPAMLFLQGYQEHKKGKAAFSFVVTVLLWRKGCISAKGSCLQEKLYNLNSLPLFTLLYCQLCSCSSRVTGTLVNSRKLVPRVNCIPYFMFRVLDHSSLKRAYKKLYLISLHRFYSFTILWTFEKKLCFIKNTFWNWN